MQRYPSILIGSGVSSDHFLAVSCLLRNVLGPATYFASGWTPGFLPACFGPRKTLFADQDWVPWRLHSGMRIGAWMMSKDAFGDGANVIGPTIAGTHELEATSITSNRNRHWLLVAWVWVEAKKQYIDREETRSSSKESQHDMLFVLVGFPKVLSPTRVPGLGRDISKYDSTVTPKCCLTWQVPYDRAVHHD